MKRRTAFSLIASAALCLLPLAAPAQAQSEPTREERAADLAALRAQEQRVATIGERLSAAAARAGWCDRGYSIGWALGDLYQYPKNLRATVRSSWQVPGGVNVFVSTVVPGGVAARAGITPGMGIISIDGRRPMRLTADFPTRYALSEFEDHIGERVAAGPIAVEIMALDGTRRTITLTGANSCPTRFELAASEDEQAYADGDLVMVTSAMGEYTDQNDAELAAVIAHELAHNMLRHIQRSRDAGTPNSYQRYLGRYARISRGMEEEADRLSVWLLAISGFEPRTPVLFWERFGPTHDTAHPFGRLHNPWRERVVAIQDELTTMQTARRGNPRARPALLDRRTQVPQTRPASAAAGQTAPSPTEAGAAAATPAAATPAAATPAETANPSH